MELAPYSVGMAKVGYALLPSILFASGCPTAQPDDKVVHEIERKLAEDPCLKGLEKMRRTYQFAKRGWKIDPNRVDIHITEAGYRGLPAGRFAISVEREGILDDSEHFGAFATYVVDRKILDLWSCGGNMDPASFRHQPKF